MGYKARLWLVWACYLICILIGVAHHELWLDELQVWGLAKASPDWSSFFAHMKYEGHPPLWHLLVWGLTQITSDVQSIQYLHALIVATTGYIVLFKSPFSFWQKVLLLFGYFFIFEYGLISRNYNIGLCLIFAICSHLQYWYKHKYTISVLLFLLCQTNVFGVMFSIGFTGLITYWYIENKTNYTIRDLYLPLCIIVVGILLSVYQMIPPADTGYAVGWHLKPYSNIAKAITTIFKSYFPVPDFSYHFWDSHFILSKSIKIAGTILVLAFVSLRWYSQKSILLFFWFMNLALWAFFYTKHYGAIRHHGHVYVAFVVSVWLSHYVHDRATKPSLLSQYNQFAKRYFSLFFVFILVVQTCVGMYAYKRDYSDSFSQAGYMATYLKKNNLDSYMIAGERDMSVMPVAVLLQKPLYYFSRKEEGTFIIWDNKRRNEVPDQEVIQQAHLLRTKQQKPILLLMNRPLKIDLSMRLLMKTNDCIANHESYWLYEMN